MRAHARPPAPLSGPSSARQAALRRRAVRGPVTGGPRPQPLPPTGGGRRFVRHAFVCLNDEACLPAGADAVRSRLKGLLRQEGRKEEFRVNAAGCFGQCGHGPLVVVYPEGIWYSHVTPADAERIWSQHIVGGRPVEDLLYRTAEGGTNVVAQRPPGVPDAPHASSCSRCPPPPTHAP